MGLACFVDALCRCCGKDDEPLPSPDFLAGRLRRRYPFDLGIEEEDRGWSISWFEFDWSQGLQYCCSTPRVHCRIRKKSKPANIFWIHFKIRVRPSLTKVTSRESVRFQEKLIQLIFVYSYYAFEFSFSSRKRSWVRDGCWRCEHNANRCVGPQVHSGYELLLPFSCFKILPANQIEKAGKAIGNRCQSEEWKVERVLQASRSSRVPIQLFI